MDIIDQAAAHLAGLYQQGFGGKESGRYRISMKLLRRLTGRRRLYEQDIAALGRALLERGYVLIDMGDFCVVMSAGAFANYRRANEDCLP